MTTEDKCPLCVAERTHDYGEHQAYACGTTTIRGVANHVGRPCLERQLAQANAILDKLPKTADGEPVVPGATLYLCAHDPERTMMTLNVPAKADYCWYSTREAAKATGEQP